MLVLTDSPYHATPFLPQGDRWTQLSQDSFLLTDRHLCSALCLGEECRASEIDGTQPADFLSCVTILEHATSPQFDILSDFLDDGPLDLSAIFWKSLTMLGEKYCELDRSGHDTTYEACCKSSLVVGEDVRIWEESCVQSRL